MNDPLHMLCIVVTRPHHLAADLCQRLSAHGAVVLEAPCIEIVDATDKPGWPELLGDLQQFCAVVFISRNAAIYGCRLFATLGLSIPQDRVFAVGAKTAQQLSDLGVSHVLYPEHGVGSRALLAQPEFANITEGNVLIVRGEGGSETLKEALDERGVNTKYAEVYRRAMPEKPMSLGLPPGVAPDAILAASTESLYNLQQIIDPSEHPIIHTAQTIVASNKAQKVAAKLGFQREAIRASSATDDDMIEALLRWVTTDRQEST